MSLSTPPRFGPRIPLPPAPKDDPDGQVPRAPDELGPGDLIEGRYQIEAPIGEGGVGLVYSAMQLKLHRRVAIKLLSPEANAHDEMRPRFQQEALTLAALSHPNIVALQDYGVVRGRPFLVLELLEGRTLRALLDDEGALVPRRALTLTRQIAIALAYAHERGIVHRDLKPANVIVQVLPAHEHVKVLDFGMVKLLPTSSLHRGEALTRVGFTAGTPSYMSPEHATGAEVDGRSDLYSLGILLFELVTGQKPFDGEIQDVLRAHLTEAVPRPAEVNPALAGDRALEQLLDRMLEKDRTLRIESALAVVEAIDAMLGVPTRPGAVKREVAHTGTEDFALEDALGLRSGLHPLLAQGRARGAALMAQARSSYRVHGKPQIARAEAALSALAARLGPWSRKLAHRTWVRLHPLVVRAVEGLSRLALAAKQRIEENGPSSRRPTHEARTSGEAELHQRAAGEDNLDLTSAPVRPILALPAHGTVSGDTRTSEQAADEAASSAPPAALAHVDTLSFPVKSARDTAEPIVLEPRDAGRTSTL